MKNISIIPMFDTKKWENIERACEGQVDHYKVKLPFEKRKHRKYIDPEFILSGNWLPQDALGGHQWNSHLSKWVID